jgi:hypothetical protein
MNSSSSIKWIFGMLLVTSVIGWRVWAVFDHRETQALAQQQAWLENQRLTWSQEDSDRAIAVRRYAGEVALAHQKELLTALGGRAGAIAKNPMLDISGMLTQLAQACAPRGVTVSVTVDRFTEFDAALESPKTLSTNQLATAFKPLLDYGGPYLQSLRFLRGNQLVAELDGAAIESVSNWSDASVETFEHLLLVSGTTQPRTNAAITTPAETAPEDLNNDQKKIAAAQAAFSRLYNEHWQSLNEMLNKLDLSLLLDSSKPSSQLQDGIDKLNKLDDLISDERNFFLNQPTELGRLLGEQGSDPLAITIMERTKKKDLEGEILLIDKMFDAISAYRSANQEFLKSMLGLWGEWTVDSFSPTIQFTSQAIKTRYRAANDPTQIKAEAVRQAIAAWTGYQKSQGAIHEQSKASGSN